MSLGTLVLVAAVKGSVLLLAAWLVMRAFPRMSAALRHLLWASALGGLVLMPLLVRVVPTLRSAFVPAIPIVTSIQTDVARVSPIVQSRSAAPLDRTRPDHVVAPSVGDAQVSPRRSIDLQRAFPIAWAVIAAVLLLRVAFGRLRLFLLARDAGVVDDGDWLLLVQRLAHRLDISRPITLLQSGRSCVPMTWGLVYPTVLLPADADRWSEERRTIVLLHELAHVNRLDAFTQLVAQLATAVFWFNPLAWLAARAMRVERELACDDCVLANGARASDYAQDLLQIARAFSKRSDFAVAALAMARRGDLEDRLLAILDPAADRSAVSRGRLAVATLGILALSIPLAALSPAPVQAAERSIRDVMAPVSVPTVAAPHRDSVELTVRRPTAIHATRRIQRILSTSLGDAVPGLAIESASPRIPTAPAATLPAATTSRRSGAEPDRETLISVAHAAAKLSSNYDKAELLVPIAKYYVADEELASAYVAAAATITGDYDCARTFNALLAGPAPLSDKVVEAAMSTVTARKMSDYEKGTVIAATVNGGRVLGPDARRAIIRTIATLGGGYERHAAITAFLEHRQFNEQDAIGLINAAATIPGSYDRASALIDIAMQHGLDDAGVRQAYTKAVETIKSAPDYRRAIEVLIRRPA